MNHIFICYSRCCFQNKSQISKNIYLSLSSGNMLGRHHGKNPFWSLAATLGSVMLLKGVGGRVQIKTKRCEIFLIQSTFIL